MPFNSIISRTDAAALIPEDASREIISAIPQASAVMGEQITLVVSDWFGGTASRAGEWHENYSQGRLLKKGDRLKGTLRLRLTDGKTGDAKRHQDMAGALRTSSVTLLR